MLMLLAGTVSSSTAPAEVAPPSADLTRANFIAEMDAEFRKRDLDGDKIITRAEMEAYARNEALAQAQSANAALFRQLDVNADGMLSPGEFAAAIGVPRLVDVNPDMIKFDGNGDNKITPVEFRGATLQNFDRLDTDHDGNVTAAEMKAGNIQPVQ